VRLRRRIDETDGQLLYEWRHLQKKLGRRAPEWQAGFGTVRVPAPHPLFHIVPGEVRQWERVA
jgi:hypothetical protein